MSDNGGTRAVDHRERREQIATAVLAAIYTGTNGWGDMTRMVECAVKAADALIAELDKEPSR